MSLDPQSSNFPKRELPEEGIYTARCFGIIDLGLQTSDYKGTVKTIPKVMLCFEVPEFMFTYKEEEGPQPLCVYQAFSKTNGSKSNIIQAMISWRKLEKEPELVDIAPYLGQYCRLDLIQSKSGKSMKIAANGAGTSIKPLIPKGAKPGAAPPKKPVPVLENIMFDLDKFSWEQ